MSDLERTGMFGVLIGLLFGAGPFMGVMLLWGDPFLSSFFGLLSVSLAAQLFARSLRRQALAHAGETDPRGKLKSNIDEFVQGLDPNAPADDQETSY